MNLEATTANEKTLTEDVSNDEQSISVDVEWIQGRAAEYPLMGIELLTEWWTQSVEKITELGIDKMPGVDDIELISIIRASVVNKIQENVKNEAKKFQIMVLGPYPQKIINQKKMVEMVGFASNDNGNPDISTITAWGDLTSCVNDIKPLGSYETEVSFDEDDRKERPKRFKLSVEDETEFSDNTEYDMAGLNYDEKLEFLRAGVPHVELGEAGNNLSRLNDNWTDTFDLKRVKVQVVGFKDGVDKNRRDWAMYMVIDGSFKPTVKVKSVVVWIDPSIYNKLQAGKDSYLEIYGTIQKDNKGQISMSACFVHPIVVVPMEIEHQIQTDQQPQVVFQVMNSSDGM